MTAVLTAPAAPALDTPHEHPGRTALRLAAVELRLLLREPMVAIGLLGFPLVTMLVIAGVFGQVPDPEFGGVAPDDHYIAGYIGVVLGGLGVITLPVFVATARELGVTRRFRASGVSAGVLVAARVVVGVVLGIAVVSVVLVAGTAAYGMSAPQDVAGVVGWLVAGLLCFIALGLAIGSLAPSGRSANAIANLLFVPMLLLGGGGPPRQVMSGAMLAVSDALPLTHVVGGLRQAWLGQTDDPHLLWYPVLVAGVAVVAALAIARRRVT
jgi:ABC-2 type transport system permease protein